MQPNLFLQKITQWTQIINHPNKNYPDLTKLLNSINDLLQQQHQHNDHSQKLSAPQINRVKALKLLVKKQMQKYENFQYYFDPETKTLCDNIRNNQQQNQLCANRLKLIDMFSNINHSNVQDKSLKLHKLQKLIAQADSIIQQKQAKLFKPLNLAGKIQEASSEYKSQINFFLIVAWIISFLLANKDPSECLAVQLVGSLNFRHWLWANGAITLYLTVTLVIFDIFSTANQNQQNQQDDQEQSFEHLETDQIVRNILNGKGNFQPMQISENANKKQQQEEQGCCSSLSFVLFSIGFLAKLFWIFFGIVIFLNDIDFDTCSDNVLNYCSLEFLAFFSFIVYGFISLLISIIKTKSKKPLEIYPSDQELKQMVPVTSDTFEPESKLPVQGNIDDLQDVLKKIVVWTLVGWVYDFVLFRKDHSGCLDEIYDSLTFTYRDWLLIDGIACLVTFVFAIFLIIVFIVKHENFMIWQLREELFEISMSCVSNNLVLTIIFGLLVTFKVVWLVVGVVVLCVNVSLGDCSGNVPNFLVAYFTESVYVMIFMFSSLVKGWKRKRENMRENPKLQQSGMKLMEQKREKSEQKMIKQAKMLSPKKMIIEQNSKRKKQQQTSKIKKQEQSAKDQKKTISQAQVLPTINNGSRKDLLSAS